MLALSSDLDGHPPEGVDVDHRRCIVHFDIDCFYAQASRGVSHRCSKAERTLVS